MGKVWIPIESNPEVMTAYVQKLGIDTSQYSFHDVFGLDPELLAMVPQPVKAVIMCFPVSDEIDAVAKQEDEKVASQGRTAPESLFYMKQTISNACGTIAILHGLCNNTTDIKPAPGSFLAEFMTATSGMTPAERGRFLESPPEGAPDIEEAHQAAAAVGDTAPPSEDEVVNLHFTAFVHKDGTLWELDGRRMAPVPHGPTTPENLLNDAAEVLKKVTSRISSLNFNLMALAPTSG